MTDSTRRVTSLHVYPLKSAASVDVGEAVMSPRGMVGDRRWMLIDETGEMLSSRRHPRLLLVRCEWGNALLECRAEGKPPLKVMPPTGEPTEVMIWGQHTGARDAGDGAARWFSDYLGRPCRLVFQSDADQRPVESWPTTRDGDHVSFADGFPVLVIGTASLQQLNAWIDRERPVPMSRFRPNLVIETETPFEEDRWTTIRVGEVELVNVKPCERCVLTTYDPTTAEKDPDGEPLRTLARHRSRDGGVLFGTNLVPRSDGTLRVGDPVLPDGS